MYESYVIHNAYKVSAFGNSIGVVFVSRLFKAYGFYYEMESQIMYPYLVICDWKLILTIVHNTSTNIPTRLILNTHFTLFILTYN